MLHRSQSFSPHPSPAPALFPWGLSPAPCSQIPRPTHFQTDLQWPPNKDRVFPFVFQTRVLCFLVRSANNCSGHPFSAHFAYSPQRTPSLPLLLIFSKLGNQRKSESIFVLCVTKYLCIVKNFSCEKGKILWTFPSILICWLYLSWKMLTFVKCIYCIKWETYVVFFSSFCQCDISHCLTFICWTILIFHE